MAKKEKIVDLKSKPEKITDEQLKKVQETVNTINRAQIELGSMELRKHEMLHQLAGVKDELTLLQNELKEEYGTVDVNINDGTINYDGEADS
jgi:allophanate hydrolase subunit 1